MYCPGLFRKNASKLTTAAKHDTSPLAEMSATPYSLYMFGRSGELLQYIEWSRPRPAASPADDARMMFGLLHSLARFAVKVDPYASGGGGGGAQPSGAQPGFHTFRTNTYKLHYLETATGLVLALTTEPGAGDAREALRHIHASLYTELVAKSPLHTPGKPFVSEPFVAAVRRYLAGKQ